MNINQFVERLMFFLKGNNHYDLLEISKEASSLEIRQAFKKLTMRFPNETHPEQFLEVKDAYELLMDQEKRKRYDEELKLGQNLLSKLQLLEERMYYDFEQVQWSQVQELDSALLKSERVAYVVLEASLLLNQINEGMQYGERLKKHNRLTKQSRLLFSYILSRAKQYEEAIRELKILSFEENETNIETLTQYGEVLMLNGSRKEAMERYERWIMKHPNQRILLWKSWIEAIVFWGRKEELEAAMRWMARFTDTEKQQVTIDINELLRRTIEYQRYDAAYFLIETYEALDIDFNEDWVEGLMELGGVMEEMTMAEEAKNIPLNFLFPVYEWIDYLKKEEDEEENRKMYYSSLEHLYQWLQENQTNRAWIAKFCLLYPKSYQYLQTDYDQIFNLIGSTK